MSTFDLYVANMKPLLYAMIKNSELVICNRCDGIEDLSGYLRTLNPCAREARSSLRIPEGEIDEIADEDLPYDMGADVMKFRREAYGGLAQSTVWTAGPLRRKDCGIYGHGIERARNFEKLLCSGTYGHDLL